MKKEISGSSTTSLLVCSCFFSGLTLIPLGLTLAVSCWDAHFFYLLVIGYLCGIFFLADCLYFLLRPQKEEAMLLTIAMLSCGLIQFPYVSYEWFGTGIEIIPWFYGCSILLILTHAAFFTVLFRNAYRKRLSAHA